MSRHRPKPARVARPGAEPFPSIRPARRIGIAMNSARHRVARSLLLLTVGLLGLAAPSERVESTPAAGGELPLALPGNSLEGSESAGIRPEGRLRKLHLVRPDLIPYPIAYEVYC